MFKIARAAAWTRWWHERLVGGTLLVRLSDVAGRRPVLKQLEQAALDSFAQNCYHTLAGEIALAEGKPGEAVQQLCVCRGAQYPRVIYHRGAARARSPQQRDWQRAWPIGGR